MASFWVPLDGNLREVQDIGAVHGDWAAVVAYFAVATLAVVGMFAVISAFLRNRWGMTGR